jgi:hypothetical protein
VACFEKGLGGISTVMKWFAEIQQKLDQLKKSKSVRKKKSRARNVFTLWCMVKKNNRESRIYL